MKDITLDKIFWKKQFFVAIGALVFVLPYNLLITPMQLYAGNFTGIAQIIRTLLIKYAHLSLPSGFDITGILLYILNIPLLILAYKKIGKPFFFKTIITITLVTIFFSIVPVPDVPLLQDPLTACLLAGCIAGTGAGLILRQGSSGGGLDIIGIYMTQKRPNFSVGKVVIFVAAFVFIICFFLYDYNIEVVVYSAIFTFTSSFALDKAHYQTVKMSAIIFTKNPEVASVITEHLKRGGTKWKGEGIYSHEDMLVYMTVVSRYEVSRLKREVHALDPHAFIAVQRVSEVEGFFQVHL